MTILVTRTNGKTDTVDAEYFHVDGMGILHLRVVDDIVPGGSRLVKAYAASQWATVEPVPEPTTFHVQIQGVSFDVMTVDADSEEGET